MNYILGTEYSIADNIEKRVESPFQRFARLRSEVQELQNDVQIMLQVLFYYCYDYESIQNKSFIIKF